VPANVDVDVSQPAGFHDQMILRRAIARLEPAVERMVRKPDKLGRQRRGILCKDLDCFLGFNVGHGNALQLRHFRLIGKRVMQCRVDVLRRNALPFDSVAVVRTHASEQFAQCMTSCRMGLASQLDGAINDLRRPFPQRRKQMLRGQQEKELVRRIVHRIVRQFSVFVRFSACFHVALLPGYPS
jgi:hypothetical protein